MLFNLWWVNTRKIAVFISAILFGLLTTSAAGNPVFQGVAAGSAAIQQTAHTTTINQASQKAIINWQSFNIGKEEATHFQQPAGGVALNYISPTQGASSIYGTLTATGQIILVNPAGVYFGPSAYVNVGGLIATTANISAQDFLNGHYHFVQSAGYNGSVINEGTIIAAKYGLVALIGNAVSNTGMIEANLGHAVLASGREFSMTMAGNSLISFTVDSAALSQGVDQNGRPLRNGVSNAGSIIANGGSVLITASAASGVLDHAINMSGYVESQSATTQNGRIFLTATPGSGSIQVANATLNASGKGTGQTGGKVQVMADKIVLGAGTIIDVSGNAGGGSIKIGRNDSGHLAQSTTLLSGVSLLASTVSGNGGSIETSAENLLINDVTVNTTSQYGKTGTWLLDPTDYTIDNSNIASLISGLNNSNVTIQTTNDNNAGNGDITVATNIGWSTNHSLILTAFRNINLNANITNTGGASVNLIADNTGTGTGTVTSSGGSNVSLSGGSGVVGVYYNPGTFGTQDTIYSGGTTPTRYMLINTPAQLATLSITPTFWSKNFALGKDINATGTTVNPIGTYTQGFFTGKFDGQGHVISNLSFSPSVQTDNVALFGVLSGTVKNLGLDSETLNFTLTTNGNDVGGLVGDNYGTLSNVYSINENIQLSGGNGNWVGGLVGYNGGSISGNAYSTGTITISGSTPGVIVGGLIGYNGSGRTLNNVYSTSSVTSSSNDVGGLIGQNYGTVNNAYSTGRVIGNGISIGGLVGSNSGTITGSYHTTGNVTGSFVGGYATGGLVGYNNAGGSISNSYSTGITVTGYDTPAGLVGVNNGTITNSYSTNDVNGGFHEGGLVGYNTGTISSSHSSGTVNGSQFDIAGLAGFNSGTITGSYSTSITSGGSDVGGLAGENWGTITGSWSTGGVTAASFGVGGLVGYNNATITNSYSTSSVNQTSSFGAGGLVGYSASHGFINNSYSTGTVTGFDTPAGLVGVNNGFVFNSYSTSNVTGGFNVGGLVGYNTGFIYGSYATSGAVHADLAIPQIPTVGGLAGFNSGTIINSWSSNTVHGLFQVGGLVGENHGYIAGSWSSSMVNGSIGRIGGLVGYNNTGTITSSYSIGSLTTTGHGNGGLVGENGGSISNSYSTANVSNFDFFISTKGVGGLVGYNDSLGSISNSYSTGSVSDNNAPGGLVGNNEGTVTNSYSSGHVSSASHAGGLVAINSGSITNSFWDIDTSGQASSAGGTPKHTSQLLLLSTYDGAGWSIGGIGTNTFSKTWLIFDGVTRPMLAMEYSTTINTPHALQLIAINNDTLGASYPIFYTIGRNIDLGGTSNPADVWAGQGFIPIGNATTPFSGTLDGQNHTVSNLAINLPSADYVGLFGYSTGNISNLGMSGNVVGNNIVGMLAGFNAGTIANVYSLGTVTGSSNEVGGLVGNNTGSITNSHSQGSVSGISDIGGFAGLNSGTILNAYSISAVTSSSNDTGGLVGSNTGTGSITNAYSIGTVAGDTDIGGLVGNNAGTVQIAYSQGSVSGTSNIGGLVGLNSGTIQDAYSISAVTSSGNAAGGLVGSNSGNINNTYSSGLVSGPTAVGGLAGFNSGSITNSFWDTDTSGQLTSAGGTGETTDPLSPSNLLSLLTYANAGWDIGTDPNINTWLIFDGFTRPMLAMEYSTTIKNAHQFQLIGINTTTLGASYTLANDLDLSSISNPSDIWNGKILGIGNGNPFTGSFNGNGYQITHIDFLISRSATLTNFNVTGTVVVDQTELLIELNKPIMLPLTSGNLTICTSGLTCSDNLILSDGVYGNNTALTLPVEDLRLMLQLGSIEIQTTDKTNNGLGDIIISPNGSIQLDSANNLILNAYRDIHSSVSLINNDSGSLILSAGNSGSGTGKVIFDSGANVNLSGGGTVSIYYNPDVFGTQDPDVYTGGTTPTRYMLINELGNPTDSSTTNNAPSLATLVNSPGYWNENFALSTDIDASAATAWNGRTGIGFIGNYNIASFSGLFDGQGHTISNLTMVGGQNGENIGLFHVNTGTISNIGLVDANITGTLSAFTDAGILVGDNYGTVNNAFVTGSLNVSGTAGNFNAVGGLIGYNVGTAVSNNYSSVAVTGNNIDFTGGLVGQQFGILDDVYSTGSVNGSSNVGGLVGVLYAGAVISNSNSSSTVIASGSNVGGLVGLVNSGSSISDSHSSGSVTGNNAVGIGGLVGTNNGNVTNSFSTSSVYGPTTNNGARRAGGLVGFNTGNIYYSHASGTVFSSGNSVGGLVGNNTGNIDYSYTTGKVITNNDSFVGGLAGFNSGTVTNSYSTGSVTTTNGTSVGGLVGESGGSISDSHSSAIVTNTNIQGFPQYTGGLVGHNDAGGSINNSYSTGTVTGDVFFQGGLVGFNEGNVTNSYSTSNVNGDADAGGLFGGQSGSGIANNVYSTGTVTGDNTVGGLVGHLNGSINSAYSSSTVSGSADVGGLVGRSEGASIYNSYSTGTVTGNFDVGGLIGYVFGSVFGHDITSGSYSTSTVFGSGNNIGGLVGENQGGTITGSWFSGSVTNAFLPSYHSTGGLVGLNDAGDSLVDRGSIINSYSTGTVTGYDSVGGLVGYNLGDVTNSYSSATVSGGVKVGGLVGYNTGSISDTYASGLVITRGYNVGGLTGYNTGSVSKSFWDTQTTGQLTSDGGTGLTTAQLLNLSTYGNASWDIGTDPNTNTWLIFNGLTRPMLAMEYSTINTPHALQLIAINSNTLGASYTLGNNIDLSVASNPADVWAGHGFIPVGNASTPFSGTFNGLGNLVNLAINLPSQNNVGLFGVTSPSALISNIGISGSVTGNNSVNVGMLVGLNEGTVINAYSLGTVTGGFNVGDLVGNNAGTVQDSWSQGSVSGKSVIGGLVGLNSGTIQDAYSISPVTSSLNYAGGLVGGNASSGIINNTYSSGVVSGPAAGGLAGFNQGSINHSFWDTETSGQAASAGGTGKTTTQLLSLSTYGSAFWNIGTNPNTNTWLIFDGVTRPMLAMEYSTTITNAHQLQLVGISTTTLGASYTLANNLDLSSIANNPSDVWGGKFFSPLGNDSTPFTGSFNGNGHQITHLDFVFSHLDFVNHTAVLPALMGTVSPSALLTDINVSGKVLVDQTEFDFAVNNYAGGTFFKTFLLPLTSGNLTICSSCADNLILSGSLYGTSTQLTFPVQDLTDLLKLGNVYIQTAGSPSSGDIDINTPVQFSSPNALEFSAYRNINVNAAITNTGSGNLLLSSGHNDTGLGIGTVTFNNGANVTLSGGQVSIFYNPATFGTPVTSFYSGGTTPTAYMLINSLGNDNDSATTASLGALSNPNNSSLWGLNFALSTDINAAATASWNGGAGFSPIGSYVPGTFTPDHLFTGKFDGQGHIISNLTISPLTAEQNAVGLFGVTGTTAVISNLGLNNTHIIVTLNFDLNAYAAGTLIGDNFGTVNNVFSANGVIEVKGQGFLNPVGGLIGYNNGSVSNAYASGFINYNNNLYASNVVFIGGLTGLNDGAGTLNKTYNTTAISFSGASTGGLVGVNLGNVQNSFWDADVSGQASAFGRNAGVSNNILGGCRSGSCTNPSVGVVNLTSSTPFTAAGWDFNNTWGIIPGQSYPYLLSVYPTTPRVISGQVEQFTSFNPGLAGSVYSNIYFSTVNPVWSSLAPVAQSGQTINLIANGTILDSATTGANGTYYFLERNGAIPDNAPLLADLSNSTNKANTVTTAPVGGASMTNLILALNTLLVDDNGLPNYTYTPPGGSPGIFDLLDFTLAATPRTLVSNNDLGSVLGNNLVSNDLLYSTSSGNQINVGNGYLFVTSPDVLFGLTGNIITNNASITFNGPTQIGPLSAGSSVVTLQTNSSGDIETGNVISATSNPYTLNLYSANHIFLNGLLLLRDSNSAGARITDGSLNVSAVYMSGGYYLTDVTITTNQSNGGFLVENFNLLQGNWFQQGAYDNHALGNFQINSGIMPSSVAEYLQFRTVFDNSYIIDTLESLQGIGSDSHTLGLPYEYTGGNYALSSIWNYDASTGQYAGFVPIGSQAMPFTGTFTTSSAISGVYINRPNTDNVGIFGVTGSSAVLSNVYVTGNAVTGHDNVGLLVGLNQGTIQNVMGMENFVVGHDNVGSLVGSNSGSIVDTGSFNSRVLGHTVGGLVGYNSGSIDRTLAAVYVGGLGSSPITGGLVGINNTGTIQDSFWDVNVTGQTSAAGLNIVINGINGIYDTHGGCYGAHCRIDLTAPGTYLTTADGGAGLVSSSWSVIDPTWTIQPEVSYPYLTQMFQTQGTTARVLSGRLTPASPNELLVGVSGFLLGSTASVLTNVQYFVTGADGSFYNLMFNNTISANTPQMLISAVGGNITGSVVFNFLQPSLSNPTGSQIGIPLQTIAQANPAPTNFLALGNRQIDNLVLGLPIDTVSGDTTFYYQQEFNIIYSGSSAGYNYLPAEPGIYFLGYVYAIANANLYNSQYYFYQRDLYSDVRKYLASHSIIGENMEQLIRDFQAWDRALMNRYEIAPVLPAGCFR